MASRLVGHGVVVVKAMDLVMVEMIPFPTVQTVETAKTQTVNIMVVQHTLQPTTVLLIITAQQIVLIGQEHQQLQQIVGV